MKRKPGAKMYLRTLDLAARALKAELILAGAPSFREPSTVDKVVARFKKDAVKKIERIIARALTP